MADVTITAASVLASAAADKVQATAGATITAGQPVYIDAADENSIKPAQATSAKNAAVGIALHAAADGQPITYARKDSDFTVGGTVAVGTVYCVSATAGGIAPVADLTTGDYTTILGVATTTSKIRLDCVSALRAGAAIA